MNRSQTCRAAVVLGGLVLAVTSAHADLPAGWSVYPFAGRIHEIEPAGGVLACATDGGLLLFDPETQTFAPPIADAGCSNGDCLASNHLSAVSRDGNGNYWLGTAESGVVVFRPRSSGKRFGRFFALSSTPGGNLLADSVTCIEAWRTQAVYVGTSQGVAQIDVAGAVESYNQEAVRRLGQDLKGNRINDLTADSLFVWVATDSGVSRYTRQPPYTVEFLADSLSGQQAFTLKTFAGVVHAGTSTGVFTWQPATHAWRRILNFNDTPATPTPAFVVRSLVRRADGKIFAGSNGTVWFYNNFVWGQLAPSAPFALNDREFQTMVATGDTAWTCQQNADGEGAYLDQAVLTRAPIWQRYEANGSPPSEVQALDLASDGTLWIGTRLGGVGRLGTDGTWCAFNSNDPVVRANMTDADGHVRALVVGTDGRVWFHALPNTGDARAIDILAPGAGCDHSHDDWAHIPHGDHRFDGRYWRTARDADGNLFFLSDGDAGLEPDHGGIDVASSDLGRFVSIAPDTLGGSAVGALAFDSESAPWTQAYVGLNGLTNHGLKRWDRAGQLFPPSVPGPFNFSELALPSTISVSEYRDIVVLPGTKTLWIGTDSGVFEYDALNRRVVTNLRAKVDGHAGLISGDVKDLQLDRFGNLWIATVKGLNRIRLDQRQPAPVELVIETFTTIETIRERNAASTVGQLYDPRRALAPLPAPKVNGLSYDAARDRLWLATEGGTAVIDVAGLSQHVQTALDQVVLYPNPVRLDAGHREVRLAKLSEPATVTIYTIEGEEVCTVTDREDGDIVWTLGAPSCLESEGNFHAASGAYLVRITTSAGSTMRTLVVIQ